MRPVLRRDSGADQGRRQNRDPYGWRALEKANGIQVLYGNLAPQGALVKTSAVPENVRVFEGTAKVFDGEDACYAAFRDHAIHEGDAVIVRYEGPKGGPGMEGTASNYGDYKGNPRTAVITDGRFSGASGGLKHRLSLSGGRGRRSIALVKNGDRIQVDLYKGMIHLDVSDEELISRRNAWEHGEKEKRKGPSWKICSNGGKCKAGSHISYLKPAVSSRDV